MFFLFNKGSIRHTNTYMCTFPLILGYLVTLWQPQCWPWTWAAYICGQRAIGQKCQPHTHTLWQPHRHTHKSTSRWSPSVWAHCVFVWATKFNYLGTGQIYGSLEISLIGKVFSPPPLTHTHTSTGGAFPWVFPNFPVYAFFSSAFARLWWHYRNFDYSGISRALAGTHTAYTLV